MMVRACRSTRSAGGEGLGASFGMGSALARSGCLIKQTHGQVIGLTVLEVIIEHMFCFVKRKLGGVYPRVLCLDCRDDPYHPRRGHSPGVLPATVPVLFRERGAEGSDPHHPVGVSPDGQVGYCILLQNLI